jgi:subfamily B ATP-binding cassette protein MsbA
MTLPPNLIRLARMVPAYKGRIALALLGMALTAATEPSLVWALKILIDRGFASPPTLAFWTVPVFVIGIFTVRGASTFMTTYMMTWVSTRVLNQLRQQMFDRLLDVPLGFYAGTSVGQVINSMMFEVQQVIDMIKNVFIALIRDSLTAIGLLGYLFWLNPQLTLITLVLIPLIALVVRLTGKRLSILTQRYLAINAELTQVLEETTRAHQVIKLFGGQQYEKTRFEQRADSLRSYSIRMAKTFAATVPITQVMTAVAVSTVIVIALIQASHAQQTVGPFIAFITNMLLLLTPLKHLAEVNGPLQRGLAASEADFKMIDAPVERTSGMTLTQRAAGRIDYIDVGFSYPGA